MILPWQLKVSFEKKNRAIKLVTNYSVVLCKIIFLVSKSEFQTNFSISVGDLLLFGDLQ
jgi:hypothetical protein